MLDVRERRKKMWISFVTLALLLSNGDALSKKKVCVIGAGMAGVATLKQLSDQIDEFEPIVFEKNSDIGGLWIYTDNTGLDEHGLAEQSRVWKNMRCYVPKEIMTYPDYREFHGRENQSIVSHEMILEYMRNYTDHFNLRQYVQFNTLVEKVSPISGDSMTARWLVETRNLITNEKSQTACHAMMICNGHFFKAYIPQIPGIESFPGRVIHSSAYRRPEMFANQTVVVLGVGLAGLEITRDLSSQAKLVYLSHRQDENVTQEFPSNVQEVKGVVAANGNRLILQDNSTISVDSFIFCTGYSYDVPFLDESIGIQVEKNNVGPLHKLIVNVNDPTMGFIGLPTFVVSNVLHTVQSKYFLAALQGKVQPPDILKTKTSELLKLNTAQWKYMDELVLEANLEKVPLFYERERLLYQDLVDHFGESNAESFDFRVLNDNDVLAVRREDGKTGTRWQDFVNGSCL